MDHTDYIRIRGLQDSETEVFQGVAAGGSSDDSGGGAPGEGTPAYSAFPVDALDQMTRYVTDMQAWQKEAEAYDPEADTSRSVLPAIPAMPSIFATLVAAGTGAVSLPVLATGFITQSLLLAAKTSIETYVKTLNPNSLEMLFKKAFLYKDTGSTEYQSIVKKALLYALADTEDTSTTKCRSIIKEYLEALQYNDEELDFGAFRAYLRSKVIEY